MPAGCSLNHFQVLESLCDLLASLDGAFDREAFVCEWVRRDLLNVAFGNSDNHGRNTAFLKCAGRITLAPVYDFAPMKADPEGVIRSTRWGAPYEEGGEYRWHAIAEKLDSLCAKERVLQSLQETAKQLSGLKGRLEQRGLLPSILAMPVMGFDYLEQKLERWGLL